MMLLGGQGWQLEPALRVTTNGVSAQWGPNRSRRPGDACQPASKSYEFSMARISPRSVPAPNTQTPGNPMVFEAEGQ